MEVKVENLSYKREEKLILENINIVGRQDYCTTILGKSGSGKTTLLHAIEGSLPIEKGKILHREKEIAQEFSIGFLPTYLNDFFKMEIVKEEIEYRKNLYQKTDIDVKECLLLLGLSTSIYDYKIRNLKNCDQKLLALFCLLLKGPSLYLLDEPTIGMPIIVQKKIEKILFYLKRKGKILFVTTRDSDLALRISDYIYIIKDGKIMREGEKYGLLKKTILLRQMGLSIPKTIHFSKKVERYKKIKIGYRDDINDLIKDIFRYV